MDEIFVVLGKGMIGIHQLFDEREGVWCCSNDMCSQNGNRIREAGGGRADIQVWGIIMVEGSKIQ